MPGNSDFNDQEWEHQITQNNSVTIGLELLNYNTKSGRKHLLTLQLAPFS